MDTHRIRPYRPKDVEQILDVWEDASGVGHPFLTESFVADERVRIRDVYLPSAATWVLEERGRVVGFISLIDNEIGALFVEPKSHRRGFGRALMEFAITQRRTLELEVFKDNAGARAFYEGCGFVVASERTHDETGHQMLRMTYDRDRLR